MKTYVTAKEMANLVGLNEGTVYNRLINAHIIKRRDDRRGFEILPKKAEFCRYKDMRGKQVIEFHFEEIRHYTAGMYRHYQES